MGRFRQATSMVIHADLVTVLEDVDVRRRDVTIEKGIGEVQYAGMVYLPRPLEFVCEGHANAGPLVVGKVEIIPAERFFYPLRYSDEGGPLMLATIRSSKCGRMIGFV